MINQRSWGPLLDAGFLYCILSASSLDSSSSGLQAPSAWCGFPYHISSLTLWKSAGNSFGTQTQLNYRIIQRPHDRPLELWNRMFNRHQAEITVMPFRGYSIPVHHCSGTMGPSPCPISWALIRPRDLFRLLAIGMCHFLPVYHLGIAFLGRSEGQNITGWENLEIRGLVEPIQTRALLKLPKILTRVLETWEDLQSLKTPVLGKKRMRGDHSNYSIIEISQNTDKSHGYLLSVKFQWETIGKRRCKKHSK